MVRGTAGISVDDVSGRTGRVVVDMAVSCTHCSAAGARGWLACFSRRRLQPKSAEKPQNRGEREEAPRKIAGFLACCAREGATVFHVCKKARSPKAPCGKSRTRGTYSELMKVIRSA